MIFKGNLGKLFRQIIGPAIYLRIYNKFKKEVLGQRFRSKVALSCQCVVCAENK